MIVTTGRFDNGVTMGEYWNSLSDQDTFPIHEQFFNLLVDWSLPKPDNFTERAWVSLYLLVRREIDREPDESL